MGLGRARVKRAAFGACLAGGLVAAVIAACSGKANNELMLALQTDLSLPKDVDVVRIQVQQAGATLFQQDYPVGPDGAHIPATLGVLDNPNGPGQPVTIRVIARQNGQLRVLKQSRTTIPAGRVATLRMPLHWLCWNHDKDPGDGGDPQPSCPDGQSCIAGACADDQVDPGSLPSFDPAAIFGGGTGDGDGTCFDTIACFSHGAMVQVQTSDCTIPKPSGGAGVDVTMVRTPGVPGICSTSACYVPIDSDAEFGWSDAPGDRIQLPKSVCDRLALPATDKLAIVGVATTTACSTKDASLPTCGPWSSAGGDAGGETQASPPAGFDAGPQDASVGLPDGATCDPATRWPQMLASPIVPPTQVGGLDLSNGGKGSITIDQAQQINCGGTPGTAIDPGYQALSWGNAGDVYVEYDPASRIPYLVSVRGGYTGTASFAVTQVQKAVPCVIGVGTFTIAGQQVTISWSNQTTLNQLVQQVYDGYMAAFFPTVTPAQDCFATGDCFANATAQANASGIGIAVHQAFPLYLVFPLNGQTPNELYTYWAPGKIGTSTDAGASAPDAAAQDASAPPDAGP